jgi:hypothetical protein
LSRSRLGSCVFPVRRFRMSACRERIHLQMPLRRCDVHGDHQRHGVHSSDLKHLVKISRTPHIERDCARCSSRTTALGARHQHYRDAGANDRVASSRDRPAASGAWVSCRAASHRSRDNASPCAGLTPSSRAIRFAPHPNSFSRSIAATASGSATLRVSSTRTGAGPSRQPSLPALFQAQGEAAGRG